MGETEENPPLLLLGLGIASGFPQIGLWALTMNSVRACHPLEPSELLRQLPPPWSDIASALLSTPVLVGASVLSAILFVLGILCASWAVRRLPEDYLLEEHEPAPHGASRVMRILRNVLGGVLLLLGVLMLALPGQGLLTILAACSLLDFPKKRQLERRLIMIPQVLMTINHLRQRSGRKPLRMPAPHAPAQSV